MIDPASSWFEIVELPVAEISFTKKNTKTKEAYFDKSSIMICNLVKKFWFSRNHDVKI